MRDWVIPFLLEDREKLLDETMRNEEDKKFAMEHFKEEIKSDEAVFSELVYDFNTNFGFGLGGPAWSFTVIFGEVLANLSKDVFLKILNIKNLFFTFTPNPGAEVKHFNLDEEEHDPKNWDRILVVTFPYESYNLPLEVMKWEIAHELAHIYAGHTFSDGDKIEDETDEIAKGWGFEAEKKAYDEYFRELYEEQTMKGGV